MAVASAGPVRRKGDHNKRDSILYCLWWTKRLVPRRHVYKYVPSSEPDVGALVGSSAGLASV